MKHSTSVRSTPLLMSQKTLSGRPVSLVENGETIFYSSIPIPLWTSIQWMCLKTFGTKQMDPQNHPRPKTYM